MDAIKRIDKIVTAVLEQLSQEIRVLLGVEFTLSAVGNALISKGAFFEDLSGKQVVVKIDLAGEVEGAGCLVVGIKDAIRLGGTLIMLPDSELEEVVGREEYAGETEDSYGEIANIVAGSYTKAFEEMFNKNFRFVRKDQQIVIPSKVDVASAEPVPDQVYYQVSCSMQMEGRLLSEMHLLMPAEPLGLEITEEALAQSRPERQRETVAAGKEDAPRIPAEPPVEAAPASPPPSASAPPPKVIDHEKQKKRIDKLLEDGEKQISTELSSLLGVEVKLSDMSNSLITKEELFHDQLEAKQVMAELAITGEIQDKSYFFASLKDSIRLGGIMIMLPPSELTNVVNAEEFGEDVQDAYSEVTNIVAGVYTSLFESQYDEKIRFVKKGLKNIIPQKVDIPSEEPIPEQRYYVSKMTLQAGGAQLGKVWLLLPAEPFHLVPPAQAATQEVLVEEQQPAVPARPAASPPPETMGAAVAPPPIRDYGFDVEKHGIRIDKLLGECCKKLQDEVGALLGAEVQFSEMDNRLVSKEDFFFEVAGGKQVMTKLDVSGDLKDTSYLFVGLKDAIRMGGVLIMLPPTELESVILDDEFGDDTRDAYGEIANIIAGVYTGVFEEQYTKKLRFVKNELGLVVPVKVDVASAEPIPDVAYYLSSMALAIEGQRLGKVHMLFPAAMLQLEALGQSAETRTEAAEVTWTAEHPARPGVAADRERVQRFVGDEYTPVDILVISDDEGEAWKLVSAAESLGLRTRQITFKDNIKSALTQELRAVYIVMRQVNEQAFGLAIKISSSCSLPLIAAGPDWTRSKVIKAVKYGVNDILLTPAPPEDIQENLDNNLVRMAA